MTQGNFSFLQPIAVTVSAALTLAAPTLAQDQLLELPGNQNGGQFGYSVALEGTSLLVGIPRQDSGAQAAGAAILYQLPAGNPVWQWSDSEGEPYDRAGTAVALSGGLALIGIPWDSANGSEAGSAQLLESESGLELFRYVSPDHRAGEHFGTSVALLPDLAFVGVQDSAGAETVYAFDTESGDLALELRPEPGTSFTRYGRSLAAVSDRLVVGAPLDGTTAAGAGKVYVYDLPSGNPRFTLFPEDPQEAAHYGSSVAISDTRIAVGAPQADGLKGAVYVYDLQTGNQLQKISLPGLQAYDGFGYRVSFAGSLLCIGAPGDSEAGTFAGAIYWLDPAALSEAVKLIPSTADGADYCGASVAASSSYLAGGMPEAFSDGPGRMAVFTTFADCNDNGVPDDDDIQFGTSQDVDGDGVPDECSCNSENTCQATENSSGAPAHISFAGSISVVSNDFTLEADACPAGQPGIFLYGAQDAIVPFGDGYKCVSGQLFRRPLVVVDESGHASQRLDFRSLTGEGAIHAHDTRYFQFWFRDPTGGEAHFNLSNGLRVTFCP